MYVQLIPTVQTNQFDCHLTYSASNLFELQYEYMVSAPDGSTHQGNGSYMLRSENPEEHLSDEHQFDFINVKHSMTTDMLEVFFFFNFF